MDILYRTLVFVINYAWRHDDDITDRLHYWYTAMLLIACSICFQIRDTVSERILCFVPAYFTDSHEKYARARCWSSRVYWRPHAYPENNPRPSLLSEPPSSLQEVTYFQWVPFLLFTSAVMFNVPCILWKFLNGRNGVRIDQLVTLTKRSRYLHPDLRMKMANILADHFHVCLTTQREYRSGAFRQYLHRFSRYLCLPIGFHYGNYMATIYICIKLLYLLNLSGQLAMIHTLFGLKSNETIMAFQLFKSFSHEKLEATGLPIEILCRFEIRQPWYNMAHLVQCILPHNMFNQKLFIVLWLWYVILLAITVCTGFVWITFLVFQSSRVRYVKKLVQRRHKLSSRDSKHFHRFVVHYLRLDGVLTLKLISMNTSEAFVIDMVSTVWRNHVMHCFTACATADPRPGLTRVGAPGSRTLLPLEGPSVYPSPSAPPKSEVHSTAEETQVESPDVRVMNRTKVGEKKRRILSAKLKYRTGTVVRGGSRRGKQKAQGEVI